MQFPAPFPDRKWVNSPAAFSFGSFAYKSSAPPRSRPADSERHLFDYCKNSLTSEVFLDASFLIRDITIIVQSLQLKEDVLNALLLSVAQEDGL